MSVGPGLDERKLLFLLGAVQFVNVLDFMMVMPLGPDFARALAMPTSALGLVGGSYTAAAAVSGLVGALFLDRFDRRKALFGALLGLVLATAAGGLAFDLPSLLAARIAAGIFGGPATSLAYAVVADVVPVERRGRAMGAIGSAFSLASVLGVPAGLELARVGGWQLPFFAVAALGAAIALAAYVAMPPLTGHLHAREPTQESAGLAAFLANPTIVLSLACTALATMSSFLLVPNISAYLQLNLGYPRDRLGVLYLVGGTLTFVSTRVAGIMTDRIGAARTVTLGCASFALTLYLGFVAHTEALPVIATFVAFMVTSTFRYPPMHALSSRVPNGRERARFMSAQSAVQHLSSALGAMTAARLLVTGPSGALVGIEQVGWLAIVLTSSMPLLLYRVQARVDAPRPLAQAA